MKIAKHALLLVFASLAACNGAKTQPRAPSSDAASATATTAEGQRDLPPDNERVAVPGFDGATSWLNVDHALTLKELGGHVTVVDFWTSCCINCLQTLPTLSSIEDEFANDGVAVVGVHSPKFDAETERTRLADAVRQYSIKHPVAVDGSMKIWNAWGVDAWPTVVVLDTKGRAVWIGSGEPKRDELETVIKSALAEGKKNGTLVTTKIQGISPEKDDTGALAFPGKITAFSGGLAISDTGHHRVVLADASGKVTDVVGSGLAGNTDGSFAEASFRKPQGVAKLGNVVYVADTENHEIRAIDLDKKTVTTVAGTGELAHGFLHGAEPARKTALRSPWDVVAVGDKIYVALAGAHQIGVLDPKAETISLFAGDGHERRQDGIGDGASFAQPSGLATDGKSLFVADSETSSVRAVDLKTANVRTIVGKDLFVFGDVDGQANDVRLKHPIGIAFGAGSIWVADTYNSKIKKIDPTTGATKTFAGGADRKSLFEPAGLVVRGNELLVADTDHHRVVTLAIANASEKEIAMGGLTAPATGVAIATATERARAKPEERIDLGDASVANSATNPSSGAVKFEWKIPNGTGVNEDAPYRVHFLEAHGVSLPADAHGTGKDVQRGFDVHIDAEKGPKETSHKGSVRADVDLVICDIATHRVCVPIRREITFNAIFGGPSAVPVTIPLPAAR